MRNFEPRATDRADRIDATLVLSLLFVDSSRRSDSRAFLAPRGETTGQRLARSFSDCRPTSQPRKPGCSSRTSTTATSNIALGKSFSRASGRT